MPRLIDADALDKKLDRLMFKYAWQAREERAAEYAFCRGQVMAAPTIEAVPVEALGKLGELMLPYKGCPRGQMGRMCGATLEEEAFHMGVITDEDGGKWVPVNEDVLRELVKKASDRPHGRWVDNHCTNCGMTPLGEELWEHLDVEPPRFELCFPFCPTCSAKMDLEEAP